VLAVEQSAALAAHLRKRFAAHDFGCVCADFLSTTPEQLGAFNAIVLNPPFSGAADIRHVRHALRFLKPGGRLVAIVAGGPRQAEALEAGAEYWEPLPSGTFEGTGVQTVLCVIRV
jgi:16S rRNA G1207 methylase RsmC